MPWAKLDDDYYEHPKFADAGVLAELLWVRMLAWAHRNLTNGFVPTANVRMLGYFCEDVGEVAHHRGSDRDRLDCDPVSALELVERLHEAGLVDPDPGGRGWWVHDYSVHQETADEAQALREKRREAGRKGGRKSAENRAKGQAEAKQVLEQVLEPDASRGQPEVRSQKSDISPQVGRANANQDDDDELEALKDGAAEIHADRQARTTTVKNPAAWRPVTKANYRQQNVDLLDHYARTHRTPEALHRAVETHGQQKVRDIPVVIPELDDEQRARAAPLIAGTRERIGRFA